MDKRVIFAVAGSGKTTYIVNQLDLINNVLIVTYTTNNVENIRNSIIRKFGYFPNNIRLFTYFTFVHSFCFKPFLIGTYKTKGLYYRANSNLYAKGDEKYISKGNRLYSNRISKFLEEKSVLNHVNERLEKYYKSIFFDEVQDFAGNDFNFLKSIAKANVNILMVGDFYQHTFDTSRDGSVNTSLHNDFEKYQAKFEEMGLTKDTTTLSKSYRCSPTICQFISDKIGIAIDSHRTDDVNVHIINTKETAIAIMNNNDIIKLFYQKHYTFNCFSKNWGECKGEDKYDNVCVVLNKTTNDNFVKDTLRSLPSQTKNKLYVACSRAKKDLYIFSEKILK